MRVSTEGGIYLKKDVFDKEHFKEEVRDHVKKLYRKTMDEASDQEIFQAVSYAVKDVELTERMVAVEQSTKQAHHRIDRLEKITDSPD